MITTKQLAEIRRRNSEGENDCQIADALGCSQGTIRYHRVMMGLPKAAKGRPYKTYTVWNAKTDELIVCGSAEDCAKRLGFSNRNIFYTTFIRARRGKNKKYIIEVSK